MAAVGSLSWEQCVRCSIASQTKKSNYVAGNRVEVDSTGAVCTAVAHMVREIEPCCEESHNPRPHHRCTAAHALLETLSHWLTTLSYALHCCGAYQGGDLQIDSLQESWLECGQLLRATIRSNNKEEGPSSGLYMHSMTSAFHFRITFNGLV